LWDLNLGSLFASGLIYINIEGRTVYTVGNEEELSPAKETEAHDNLKKIIKAFIDKLTVDNGPC